MIEMRRKLLFAVIGITAAGITLLWIASTQLFPLPKERLFRKSSTFVYSRGGELLRAFSSPDEFWRRPVKFEELPDRLVESIITYEDHWFRYHPGFNPVSMFSALIDNVRAGRIVRGGSTITMQIARMMQPKERTIVNKMIEIFRAIQLELTYSKKELLEIYFNMVAYGGNIEGVGAASLLYFGKTPDRLTISEIAILAALPVRPSEFRPDLHPEKCRNRRDQVLRLLYERKIISQDEYESAMDEEIPSGRLSLPFKAPHFSQTMASSHPDSCIIRSTIDSRIQSTCEQISLQHHYRLKSKNIHNLSVVVIDNKSAELLAMVGSPDFDDVRHGGQINGAFAPRSPGSALKPFVYALGFEDGLISPQLKLEDIPVSYGGYSPVNYDEEYHGVVSVTEALVNSYNVPAINLTARVGLKRLYDFLQSAGISTLKREYYEYGLPLILGSGEVNLAELSNLYSTFARGGVHRSLKMLLADIDSIATRLISRETCYLVSDILSGLERPDLPTCWEFTLDKPRVAWKTGTSFGRRDAWTIGYNPIFTVGVWAGNFSGEGSIDIVGAEVAARLMFDIFNEIMSGHEHAWFEIPAGLNVRKVSAVSGRPPNEYSTETINEYYIPGVSPSKKCNVTRKIYVDIRTGYRLAPDCLYGRDYEERLLHDWPPRLATWLEKRGGVSPIPPLDPSCHGLVNASVPVITSPEKNDQFVLVDHVPLEFQQILFEASSSGSGKIHWFLDNRHYATVNSGRRIFYLPEKGIHKLMCVDEQGRSSSTVFEIL